jgi:hypothetical protein
MLLTILLVVLGVICLFLLLGHRRERARLRALFCIDAVRALDEYLFLQGFEIEELDVGKSARWVREADQTCVEFDFKTMTARSSTAELEAVSSNGRAT